MITIRIWLVVVAASFFPLDGFGQNPVDSLPKGTTKEVVITPNYRTLKDFVRANRHMVKNYYTGWLKGYFEEVRVFDKKDTAWGIAEAYHNLDTNTRRPRLHLHNEVIVRASDKNYYESLLPLLGDINYEAAGVMRQMLFNMSFGRWNARLNYYHLGSTRYQDSLCDVVGFGNTKYSGKYIIFITQKSRSILAYFAYTTRSISLQPFLRNTVDSGRHAEIYYGVKNKLIYPVCYRTTLNFVPEEANRMTSTTFVFYAKDHDFITEEQAVKSEMPVIWFDPKLPIPDLNYRKERAKMFKEVLLEKYPSRYYVDWKPYIKQLEQLTKKP